MSEEAEEKTSGKSGGTSSETPSGGLKNYEIVKVDVNPITSKVKYPWYRLENREPFILEGVSAFRARQMAYMYAKRRGWKVSGKILNYNSLLIGRVRGGEQLGDNNAKMEYFLRDKTETTLMQIITDCMKIPIAKCSILLQDKLRNSLTVLGFKKDLDGRIWRRG